MDWERKNVRGFMGKKTELPATWHVRLHIGNCRSGLRTVKNEKWLVDFEISLWSLKSLEEER